jgi:hypothetical protein
MLNKQLRAGDKGRSSYLATLVRSVSIHRLRLQRSETLKNIFELDLKQCNECYDDLDTTFR